jgi:hypothetical protein
MHWQPKRKQQHQSNPQNQQNQQNQQNKHFSSGKSRSTSRGVSSTSLWLPDSQYWTSSSQWPSEKAWDDDYREQDLTAREISVKARESLLNPAEEDLIKQVTVLATDFVRNLISIASVASSFKPPRGEEEDKEAECERYDCRAVDKSIGGATIGGESIGGVSGRADGGREDGESQSSIKPLIAYAITLEADSSNAPTLSQSSVEWGDSEPEA